jgi:hypothetical protein
LTMAGDARALEMLDRLQQRFPGLFHTNLGAFHTLSGFGRIDEALRFFTPELERSSRYDVQYAMILADGLAQCGQVDRAFEYLGIAVERGNVAVEQIGTHDRMLEPIKSDPRFAALMRRAGELSAELRRISIGI